MVSEAKKKFSLQENVSNHSVRKAGISHLLDSDVPELYVAQHSGMKNTDSLGSYKVANKKNQIKMCKILDNEKNKETEIVTVPQNEHQTGIKQTQYFDFNYCSVNINIHGNGYGNAGSLLNNNMVIEDKRAEEHNMI